MEVFAFDFHGVIALRPSEGLNLFKNILRAATRKPGWYRKLKVESAEPSMFLPSISSIIEFTKANPNSLFSIMSVLESEQFIHDAMQYAYEFYGETSPFTRDAVIGTDSLQKVNRLRPGKLSHVDILKSRFEVKDLTVFDDDQTIVKGLTASGVTAVCVTYDMLSASVLK